MPPAPGRPEPRARQWRERVQRSSSLQTLSSCCDVQRAWSVPSPGGMGLLRFPDPYDFDLSTARYRRWGRDPANLWEDGALWRAVGGRDVRIAAAVGGVDVQPLDAETGAAARKLLGAEFDLDEFYAFAATEPVLARVVPPLRGLRPPLAP